MDGTVEYRLKRLEEAIEDLDKADDRLNERINSLILILFSALLTICVFSIGVVVTLSTRVL